MRKQQWTKNGKNLKIPALQLTKVRNQEVIDEARKEGKTVHFASLMNIWSWNQNFRNTKAELYSEVTL